MEELLLINPSKRPGHRRKPRSAAQKAATRRMLAANKARYHRNPVSAKTRSVRRKRKNKTQHVATYYPNPKRRHHAHRKIHHTYRRNPVSKMHVMPLIKDSAIGAVGAVLVDVAFGYMPLPAMFKTGNMNSVAKGAFAVALGVFGGKILPRNMAGEMARGSLTVTMHEALKNLVGSMLPAVHLGYYPGGQIASSYPVMNAAPAPALSEYLNPGMGEYLNAGMADVGNEIY